MRLRSTFAGLAVCGALAAAQQAALSQVPTRTRADAETNPVLVVGNVQKPTSIVLREQVTLARAITLAGGIKQQSPLVRLRVLRYSDRPQQFIFELRTVEGRASVDRLIVNPGDIIELSDEKGNFWLPYTIPTPIPRARPMWDPPIVKRRSPDC